MVHGTSVHGTSSMVHKQTHSQRVCPGGRSGSGLHCEKAACPILRDPFRRPAESWRRATGGDGMSIATRENGSERIRENCRASPAKVRKPPYTIKGTYGGVSGAKAPDSTDYACALAETEEVQGRANLCRVTVAESAPWATQESASFRARVSSRQVGSACARAMRSRARTS